MPVRPEVPVRFTSRNNTTKEKMTMGKHGKDNSDGKTSTDGNKPQGGSRGSGDKTNGNPTDGKGK
ncbi:hypothetical protein GCM10009735_48820 [Actinomadura chokoriensis]